MWPQCKICYIMHYISLNYYIFFCYGELIYGQYGILGSKTKARTFIFSAA